MNRDKENIQLIECDSIDRNSSATDQMKQNKIGIKMAEQRREQYLLLNLSFF